MHEHQGCGGSHSCGGESTCGGSCSAAENDEDARLRRRMDCVRHKILVMSGKGGVGKSTVAVNLAVALALAGKRVGLLDVDLHGPSVPKMLHLEDVRAEAEGAVLTPVELGDLKVLSIGFLLPEKDEALIWRGPVKAGVIRQFLQDVDWGDLDYLVIDSPPGTGDEPLSVGQLLPEAAGAVIVTTPQAVAVADVRKSVTFCRKLQMPILGIIENMSGFVCPECGKVTEIFKTGGGEELARDMGLTFLGRIPLDPTVVQAGDSGQAYIHHFAQTPTAAAFAAAIQPLLALDATESKTSPQNEGEVMRYAVPLAEGKLCMHFGHCEQFALLDVDPQSKKIVRREDLTPPPHEPGLLPKWLGEKGVTAVIAGGMGARAQDLFAAAKIATITGAPAEAPEKLVEAHLAGALVTGQNACDH